MSRLRSLILALSAFTCFTAATDDDYVRVTLESPAASPYKLIRYEVTRRRPATTAIHRRLLPGHPESLHAVSLMTDAEAQAAFALVSDNAALTLRDAAPSSVRPGDLTWRVDLLISGTPHSFRVTAPEALRDRRYARLIDGVRRTVRAIAGDLPFRNVFFSPQQRGWVNIVSIPAARVHIDGFDTQLETPLYAYEVASGAHTIRLVSKDGALDRSYEVRIEPSGTTNLRVDLR